jgi:hypothetical protein
MSRLYRRPTLRAVVQSALRLRRARRDRQAALDGLDPPHRHVEKLLDRSTIGGTVPKKKR